MKRLTELAEWQALQAHQQSIADQTMQAWFAQDPLRFQQFSLQVGELLLDYSKNRITAQTVELLCQFAAKMGLADKIAGLFAGEPLNTTEKRPALHTALRSPRSEPLYVNDQDIMRDIRAALTKMTAFTQKVRDETWRGATGQPLRDIVNIGIGGSHLGPLMAVHALSDDDKLRCHFISNIDAVHLEEVLSKINPETTLFIISSKSFTTLETVTNAHTIRRWVQNKIGVEKSMLHFAAVTAAAEKAVAFGIAQEQIFPVWDWVGGRYSVWSAIGLPLALMIGMERFMEFLAGAHAMDEHFRQAEFSKNMPVLMALIGIWYINFFGAQSHAIVPYAHQLNYFRAHLQQLDMESNGKRITHAGNTANYLTGPVILGEHGCNGQHAFHQLFHQGQQLVPIDFILMGAHNNELQQHHDILIASGLSQAQALMQGKTYQQALDELHAQGCHGEEAQRLSAHKSIPGNRPSNTLFIDKMTPFNLGALLALYEHKIFVQGAIWEINSFDQWGVELGKQLLPSILTDLNHSAINSQHDASTHGLIQHYKNLRNPS